MAPDGSTAAGAVAVGGDVLVVTLRGLFAPFFAAALLVAAFATFFRATVFVALRCVFFFLAIIASSSRLV